MIIAKLQRLGIGSLAFLRQLFFIGIVSPKLAELRNRRMTMRVFLGAYFVAGMGLRFVMNDPAPNAIEGIFSDALSVALALVLLFMFATAAFTLGSIDNWQKGLALGLGVSVIADVALTIGLLVAPLYADSLSNFFLGFELMLTVLIFITYIKQERISPSPWE